MRKLLLWVPTFFLSYFGLLVLPFGPVWVILAVAASVGAVVGRAVGRAVGATVGAAVGACLSRYGVLWPILASFTVFVLALPILLQPPGK